MITFYKHKIIKNDLGIFIYNSETNKIFQAGEIIEKILEQEGKTIEEGQHNLKSYMDKSELEKILKDLEGVRLLKTKNTEDIREKNELKMQFSEEPVVTSMTLLIAQECNLRCRYCYGENGQYNDSGKMSFEVAKKAIDYLYKRSGNEKQVSVIFFGGEPLINFSLITQVVNYAREKEKEFNKECVFSMTTNGILITPKIQQYLLDNDISVQVSIDGDDITTNYNRYDQRGTGAYESIINNTEGVRKNKPTSARGTITDNGLDLLHSFEHLYDTGFIPVALSPAYNMISENNYSKLKENTLKMVEQFQTYIKQKDYVKCKAMKNVYADLKIIHDGVIKRAYCSASQRSCAIDINGNIFPCHRFVANKEYSMGNVIENKLDVKPFIAQMKEENQTCNNCWVKNMCAGGCAHENLLMTGHINEASKIYCELMKSKMEKILEIYVGMRNEDKDRLLIS